MSRTVLVPKDSSLLRHSSTRVLNRYPNGSALVVTDAPISETGDSGEVNVSPGFHLDGPSGAHPKRARQGFQPNEPVFAARERPAAEDEGLISAYIEFIGPPDPRWLDQLRDWPQRAGLPSRK